MNKELFCRHAFEAWLANEKRSNSIITFYGDSLFLVATDPDDDDDVRTLAVSLEPDGLHYLSEAKWTVIDEKTPQKLRELVESFLLEAQNGQADR